MSNPNLNHNGGPILVDNDDDDRMKYIKWHIRDFLAGVSKLKPDQVGIYAVILNLIYDQMGRLEDNDTLIASHCKCEVRYYRKLRQSLLDAGKIYEADGYLYNNRALAEIAKFCEMTKKKREAAKLREQAKRDAAARAANSPARDAPDALLTRAPYAPDTRAVSTRDAVNTYLTGNENHEKHNKINGSHTTAVVTAVLATSIYTEQETEKEKKESPISPPTGGTLDLLPDEPKQRPPDVISAAFDEFWQAFPAGRRQGKAEAEAIFRKVVLGRHRNPKCKASSSVLIEAAKRLAAARRDPKYDPMPRTWLNQGRWMDDVGPLKNEKAAPQPVMDAYERARAMEEKQEVPWPS